MKTRILIAFIIAGASLCFAKHPGNFTVTETKTSLEISEAGKKVCAYQKISTPKKFSRSHYFHPVYDLSENILTEDSPSDHLHHHGLWWAWHQIKKNGKQISDGWMMDNIHLDVKKLTHSSMQGGGLLVIMNVDWLTNDNKLLVKELSEAVFHPAEKHYRIIDFNIILSSDGMIEIGGSDNVKGYGGFSVRLKEMENLEFSDSNGKVKPENTAVNAGEWMNFTWPSGDIKSGVVIMCVNTKPGESTPWILRNSKSMQNPVFPGRECVPVPKDGLTLKYRLVIHDGSLDKKQIQSMYKHYRLVATCSKSLKKDSK